ncbi:hypothetical protein ACN6K9_006600, partial [Streptomyces sp. SAS_267]|uniref:hypothetical protein n=1 Tax=Streptomyces sp. SAS_267 TaxID=3412750 RepID=UPI00403D1210
MSHQYAADRRKRGATSPPRPTHHHDRATSTAFAFPPAHHAPAHHGAPSPARRHHPRCRTRRRAHGTQKPGYGTTAAAVLVAALCGTDASVVTGRGGQAIDDLA